MSSPTDGIARTYRRFAAAEAAGRSPVYAELARRISGDERCLAFLAALPAEKRQPNLLFGAVRLVGGPITGWRDFAATLVGRAAEIARVMLSRRTQTNIPARCAPLLPALAALPPPLALVEVGASAGLCLYPDRYGYDYDGHVVPPVDGTGPVFRCAAGPGVPLPDRPVEVAWRAGLDLAPLDVTDPDDVAWLDALVWPGEEHLGAQLHAAIEVLRADPPRLVAGDLRTGLPALLAGVPAGATPVVFHTAVLAYLPDPADRQRFAETVLGSGATWLAAEAPGLVPGPAAAAAAGRVRPGEFLLCRDGDPVAATDPHGAAVRLL
ncbi:DUF2332 domain-containing protein [Pseudonocardia humida]|uniref:DUF2332 domain-containing protein n=1 Tax=Pseudonocardia humida TaxID=2800819 RepID=A0ABT1A7V5_9PSEU|nr:DUF2332 domain-containing protein [Pseudonocardia humida]MCO1658919.1 DUF2332 domain-containing protein [Pseudonocardia humida]